MRTRIALYLCMAVFFSGIKVSLSENAPKAKILSLHAFVSMASRNDITFQEILIDELAVTYVKYLSLPIRDWIVSLQGQYETIIEGDDIDGTQGTASLSKLFPYTGTDVTVSYNTAVNQTTEDNISSFDLSLSQSIAENAFGTADRYLKKITGIEEQVAQYQIIEAYEDYLAFIISLYYRWFREYKNLQTAEASHQENLKQLENMIARQKSNIALDVDVNKIRLQVLAKKERVIRISDTFEQVQNRVKQAIGERDKFNYIPEENLPFYKEMPQSFDDEYKQFLHKSRTAHIITLVENKSEIQLDLDANALLPSIAFKLGYEADGSNFNMNDPESLYYAGLSIVLPITDERDRAAHTISQVNRNKALLTSKNTHINLNTDLLNLYSQIEKTRDLIANSQDRIELAESILTDEKRNYSLGQATLNDLIVAVDKLEDNRFRKIDYTVKMKLLVTEWFRLTDQLISSKDIDR